jgi:hypothetical protein
MQLYPGDHPQNCISRPPKFYAIGCSNSSFRSRSNCPSCHLSNLSIAPFEGDPAASAFALPRKPSPRHQRYLATALSKSVTADWWSFTIAFINSRSNSVPERSLSRSYIDLCFVVTSVGNITFFPDAVDLSSSFAAEWSLTIRSANCFTRSLCAF